MDQDIKELETRQAIHAEKIASIGQSLAVHEATCTERYGALLSSLSELKATVATQGGELAKVVAKLTERGGSSRTVREIVAWVIAGAGILASLYSGALNHIH